MTFTIIATNEQIDLSHSMFDVVVFDKIANRINETPTVEEVEAAKVAKAQYLSDQGVIQETLKPQPEVQVQPETKVK